MNINNKNSINNKTEDFIKIEEEKYKPSNL